MKLKITVPTSLSDIKLSQYQKFIRTTKGSEDDNFIARQMICIFCNISDDAVKLMKPKDYDSIIVQISKVLNSTPELVTKFELNGVEYGFIPDFEDITVGEKIDIDTFYKEVETLDKAMGVIYRPVTLTKKDTYLIKKYDGKVNSLDVTLDIVFGANVFFSTLMKDLLNYTQNFITQQVESNPKAYQTLVANGGGITAFTNSLEEVFLNLKMLLNLNYTRH